MTATNLQLFQILRLKLGEQKNQALVEFVDSKLKENNEDNLRIIAS